VRPATLAGALYKVTTGPKWSELGAAAAIGADDLLDLRVTQLETGASPRFPRPRALPWRPALSRSAFSGRL